MIWYEDIAEIIEVVAMVVMVIAFYYGYTLMKFIPKELKSLNLIVFALFFMIVRRVFSICSFEFGEFSIVVSVVSLIIAFMALLGFKRMYDNVRGR